MTPRAQIRVVFGAGIDIAHARTDRIEVVDDAVQVTRAGADPVIVASAADVTDVVWLDGRTTASIFESSWLGGLARLNRRAASLLYRDGVPVWCVSGSCVVLTDRGPVAAWLVDQATPGSGDASVKRETSGSVALARSLGLTLEAQPSGAPMDRRAVRRVALLGTGERAWRSRLSVWGSLLALVLTALSFRGFDGEPVAPLAVTALVLTVSLAVLSVRMRRRTLALVDHPPAPDGRAALPSVTTRAHLQLGRDDLVLVSGDGAEYWLPGPDIVGGITQIQVVDDYLHFVNGRGETVFMQPAARLVPDAAAVESLQVAGADAGVDVDIVVAPTGPTGPIRVGELLRHGWHAGDVTVVQSWLLWPLAPMLFVAGAATAQDVEWLGRLVQAGAVLVLGCRIWCTWALRRWIKQVEGGGTR